MCSKFRHVHVEVCLWSLPPEILFMDLEAVCFFIEYGVFLMWRRATAGRHQCGTAAVGVCIQMDIQPISPPITACSCACVYVCTHARVCVSSYVKCCNTPVELCLPVPAASSLRWQGQQGVKWLSAAYMSKLDLRSSDLFHLFDLLWS